MQFFGGFNVVYKQNTGPIFSISVITKGKYAVLEAGALPHLVALFTDPSSEVRTNAVKVCFVSLTIHGPSLSPSLCLLYTIVYDVATHTGSVDGDHAS